MKTDRKLALFTLVFLAFAATSFNVAAAPPAPLAPAAQEALDKGIIAARVPDYLLAIRYFEEARKLAPAAPVVFLNLGLAESKIPGRELRAMAWFGAYLSAYPDAPNVAAVREQIGVLEARNRSNLSRLIKSLQGVAIQNANLRDVAKLYAEAGDIAEALKAADLTLTADWKSGAQTAIAEAQIRAGDIAGARNTLAVALATADLIVGDAESKSMGQISIAEAQLGAGDIAGAEKTLAFALRTADLIKDAGYKSHALSEIAETQIKAGDFAGALNALASAQKTASLVEESALNKGPSGDRAKYFIAIAQAMRGDIVGAQKTVELIRDGYHVSNARRVIVIAQAKSGDIAVAQKTADLIGNADHKSQAQKAILVAQAKTGIANAPSAALQSAAGAQPSIQIVVTVSDWLKKLDDENKSNDCPLNTGLFLDLPGQLNSLPSSNNPRTYFDSASAIAEKLVRARNSIVGMLKLQAKK
ncbi:MAG: hypothetical protein Q8Q98_14885 [Polaromonas sp.]|nr:hypothetical protein [Polaromonas sp.]